MCLHLYTSSSMISVMSMTQYIKLLDQELTHFVLIVLLALGDAVQKDLNCIVSNKIRTKISTTVQVSMYQMTESDFDMMS